LVAENNSGMMRSITPVAGNEFFECDRHIEYLFTRLNHRALR
jgi:hypothetical protein